MSLSSYRTDKLNYLRKYPSKGVEDIVYARVMKDLQAKFNKEKLPQVIVIESSDKDLIEVLRIYFLKGLNISNRNCLIDCALYEPLDKGNQLLKATVERFRKNGADGANNLIFLEELESIDYARVALDLIYKELVDKPNNYLMIGTQFEYLGEFLEKYYQETQVDYLVLNMSKLKREIALERLKEIAEKEHLKIEEEAFKLIVEEEQDNLTGYVKCFEKIVRTIGSDTITVEDMRSLEVFRKLEERK